MAIKQTAGHDALGKFAELFAPFGALAPESDWHPTGAGLLRCVEAAWRDGTFDPNDRALGNPLALLPVYTRLPMQKNTNASKLAKMPEGTERVQELRVGVADPKEGCYASSPVEPVVKTTKEAPCFPWASKCASFRSMLLGWAKWKRSRRA